jgi:hypothetical protein
LFFKRLENVQEANSVSFAFLGDVISVPSLIDFEIKKPLVLETLKLVGPQKKLDFM